MAKQKAIKIVTKLSVVQRTQAAMAQQGVDSSKFGKRPPVSVEMGKKLKEKHGKVKHKNKQFCKELNGSFLTSSTGMPPRPQLAHN